MRLAVTRIWCLLIGVIQVLFGAANFLLPLGQAGVGWGWAVIYVVLPVASGVTLLLFVLRGVRLTALATDNDDAEAIKRRRQKD